MPSQKDAYIAEARIKSDEVDTKAIAELARLDALPLSYMPPPEIAVLREKVRHRAKLRAHLPEFSLGGDALKIYA